jgi:predicted transcriptional regulator with HTH domain
MVQELPVWSLPHTQPMPVIAVLATSASVAQLAYAVTGSVTGTLRGDHTGSVSVTGSALLTGSFTGSFKGDGTNVLSVVTSSFSLTSSMATSLRANRSTLSFASPNLSASGLLGSVYTSSVQLGSETFVMIVSSSTISRVRLYYTTSSMITDISRSIGSDPSASSGVLLDTFFTGSTRILSLSPPVWVYNNDLTTNNTIYMTVTNHTASVVPISVQFTYIPI